MTSNHNSQEIQQSQRTACVSLLLLLLCSSFFALYNSNTAYTSDEVWSVKTSGLNYSSALATLKADIHPFFYYQILFGWVRVFGTGEQAVRSLSGLFYIMSVFAVYGLGRELYRSKTGLLCAAIYLTSPLAILSAQFARMYSLLSLLSVLSTWLYLQFSIKPRDSRLYFALYILVNILGTFTHIAFFFLLFAQIVCHLLFYRHVRMTRFVVAMGLSLIPYMFLWAPVLLDQIAHSGEGLAWVKRPSLSMMGDLFLLYGGAFWLVLPVLLFLWWRSGFASWRQFSKIHLISLPLWLLAITLSTPLLISIAKPIFNSRLAIVGLPLFALTIGALIGRRTNYLLPSALVVFTVVAMIVVHPASSSCDNRAMATYLSQTANDGDVVIFTSLTRLPIDYYLERSSITKNLFETSFPAETDEHPGYEGRISGAGRRATLEREAQSLIDKIVAMQTPERVRRIFFFHGFHPEIDTIVEQPLRERFDLLRDQGVKCRDASPYFKEVSVYR
ncbi:MAG: glycosyltransferase family 39 protein [Pyrinomonadaceae bacterium]|nr:glycosyltransferase family 39 protein [Pyrinomonadaceae bacterium]